MLRVCEVVGGEMDWEWCVEGLALQSLYSTDGKWRRLSTKQVKLEPFPEVVFLSM